MSVPAVKGAFTEGLKSAGESIKNASLWIGRVVKVGFEKTAEAIKSSWNFAAPLLRDAISKVMNFLRTAPGLALIGGLIGTVFFVTAETINDKKSVAIALRITAAACFVAAGAALGIGLTHGFSTQII